jgi:hypothetical protein
MSRRMQKTINLLRVMNKAREMPRKVAEEKIMILKKKI